MERALVTDRASSGSCKIKTETKGLSSRRLGTRANRPLLRPGPKNKSHFLAFPAAICYHLRAEVFSTNSRSTSRSVSRLLLTTAFCTDWPAETEDREQFAGQVFIKKNRELVFSLYWPVLTFLFVLGFR